MAVYSVFLMWGNSLRRFDEPEKEIPELTKEAEKFKT